jgi:hypothetical protein
MLLLRDSPEMELSLLTTSKDEELCSSADGFSKAEGNVNDLP